VGGFGDFFKKLCAVGREIEDNGEGKEKERELDAPETNSDRAESENHRSHGTDSATADLALGNLWILDVLGVEDIAAHPVESEPEQDDMYSEHNDGNLGIGKTTQDTRRERNKAHKHEKESIDVGKHTVYGLCIDRNEKVMRAPVGKKKCEGKYVGQKDREKFAEEEPQLSVVYIPEERRKLDLENEDGHHDSKDAIGELVKACMRHTSSITLKKQNKRPVTASPDNSDGPRVPHVRHPPRDLCILQLRQKKCKSYFISISIGQ